MCHALSRRVAAALLVAACVLVAAAPLAAATARGYSPADLRAAYNFTPLYARGITGQGQTIAFVEVDGYSLDDLWRFTTINNLPPVHVTRYSYDAAQDRYRRSTSGLPPGPEASMDLEWAHALAPGAQLAVYEVPTPTLATLTGQERLATLRDALAAALAGGAGTISLSLGAGGLSCLTVVARFVLGDLLQKATARDTAIFASSGDSGSNQAQCGGGEGTAYPASDPAVTAVGGTSLLLDLASGARVETAWSGSGGGLNSSFRRSAWQRAPGLPPGPARALPDVAFLADPHTGVAVAVDGRWHRFGGTSLGAPCWAALWSLARQAVPALARGSGGANPYLYAVGRGRLGQRAFHDIVQGSNGSYTAGPGWDFVTGWGSPDAAALVGALAQQVSTTP